MYHKQKNPQLKKHGIYIKLYQYWHYCQYWRYIANGTDCKCYGSLTQHLIFLTENNKNKCFGGEFSCTGRKCYMYIFRDFPSYGYVWMERKLLIFLIFYYVNILLEGDWANIFLTITYCISIFSTTLQSEGRAKISNKCTATCGVPNNFSKTVKSHLINQHEFMPFRAEYQTKDSVHTWTMLSIIYKQSWFLWLLLPHMGKAKRKKS